MQQVFILVNRLLQKEHTSSKRNLSIRTYKVIPLSQRSGIVEWCEGTTPLGEYLIGPQKNPFQGAHYRYRPQDWTSMDCRRRLTVRWWLTTHCNWSRARDCYKSHFLKIINVLSLSLSLSLCGGRKQARREGLPSLRCIRKSRATFVLSSTISSWSGLRVPPSGLRGGWPTPGAWPPPPSVSDLPNCHPQRWCFGH